MLKALSFLALGCFCATETKALDLSAATGATDWLSGKAMTKSPYAAALLAAPGADVRAQATGERRAEAYTKHIGEIGVGKIAGEAASALVPGGFVAKQAVGFVVSSAAKEGYNNWLDSPSTAPLGQVGGLQAKLSETDSLTGVKNGIQQYNLMKDEFDSPPPSTKVRNSNKPRIGGDPDRQLIGRVDGATNSRNGDQMIGRVPSSGGSDFLDDFVNSAFGGARRGGCDSVQYDTPNPQSCY